MRGRLQTFLSLIMNLKHFFKGEKASLKVPVYPAKDYNNCGICHENY